MNKLISAFLIGSTLIVPGASARGAESWLEVYQKGIAAAQRREWTAVVQQMTRAISAKPVEEASARFRNRSVLYVPHFWLGLALIQTGDREGGQRALRVSESHNVIQKTAYYADLRAALSGTAADASREKEGLRDARKATLDQQLGLAMSAQMRAASAGATRTDAFRRGVQELQEGFSRKKANDFDGALKSARAAAQLFAEAGTAAQRSNVKVGLQPPAAAASSVPIVFSPEPVPARVVDSTPISSSKAKMASPSEPSRRNAIRQREEGPGGQIGRTEARRGAERAEESVTLLQRTYSAFAVGDYINAEAFAGLLIDSNDRKLEGYMLRASARYTRSVLSNASDLEGSAARDFQKALGISRAARLDPKYFSPKLVAFFHKQKP